MWSCATYTSKAGANSFHSLIYFLTNANHTKTRKDSPVLKSTYLCMQLCLYAVFISHMEISSCNNLVWYKVATKLKTPCICKIFENVSCLMRPSILCPTNPSWAMPGKRWGLNYTKFKCITYRAHQSVKSQISHHLKEGDLQGDLLVHIHTSVHAYHEWSGQIVSNQSQVPHLSPTYIAREGVVEHNINRCIINTTNCCDP